MDAPSALSIAREPLVRFWTNGFGLCIGTLCTAPFQGIGPIRMSAGNIGADPCRSVSSPSRIVPTKLRVQTPGPVLCRIFGCSALPSVCGGTWTIRIYEVIPAIGGIPGAASGRRWNVARMKRWPGKYSETTFLFSPGLQPSRTRVIYSGCACALTAMGGRKAEHANRDARSAAGSRAVVSSPLSGCISRLRKNVYLRPCLKAALPLFDQ